MSFGRPGGIGDAFKVAPPARGSFPLDHEGECKQAMLAHLKCMKEAKGDVGKCRLESRRYLECRMDRGLMLRDDMANLGLGDVGTDKPLRPGTEAWDAATGASQAGPDSQQQQQQNPPPPTPPTNPSPTSERI